MIEILRFKKIFHYKCKSVYEVYNTVRNCSQVLMVLHKNRTDLIPYFIRWFEM